MTKISLDVDERYHVTGKVLLPIPLTMSGTLHTDYHFDDNAQLPQMTDLFDYSSYIKK